LLIGLNGLLIWLEAFVAAPRICNNEPSCLLWTQAFEIAHIVLMVVPLQLYLLYMIRRYLTINPKNDYRYVNSKVENY